MSLPARLLVVDDDPDVCAVVSQALQDSGYEVHCADDTRQAVTVLMKQRIDLVLIDLMLGTPSAAELARDLTEQGIRVVMMTGSGDADERLTALGHPYLLKPFRIAQLQQVVADTLATSPA